MRAARNVGGPGPAFQPARHHHKPSQPTSRPFALGGVVASHHAKQTLGFGGGAARVGLWLCAVHKRRWIIRLTCDTKTQKSYLRVASLNEMNAVP